MLTWVRKHERTRRIATHDPLAKLGNDPRFECAVGISAGAECRAGSSLESRDPALAGSAGFRSELQLLANGVGSCARHLARLGCSCCDPSRQRAGLLTAKRPPTLHTCTAAGSDRRIWARKSDVRESAASRRVDLFTSPQMARAWPWIRCLWTGARSTS